MELDLLRWISGRRKHSHDRRDEYRDTAHMQQYYLGYEDCLEELEGLLRSAMTAAIEKEVREEFYCGRCGNLAVLTFQPGETLAACPECGFRHRWLEPFPSLREMAKTYRAHSGLPK